GRRAVLTMGPSGAALVAWENPDNAITGRRRNTDGTWTAQLTMCTVCSNPVVTRTADSDYAVAWQGYLSSTSQPILVRVVEADGDVAVTSADTVAIVWNRIVASFIHQAELRTITADGTVSALTGLSDSSRDAAQAVVAGGAGGRILAGWTGKDAFGVFRAQV